MCQCQVLSSPTCFFAAVSEKEQYRISDIFYFQLPNISSFLTFTLFLRLFAGDICGGHCCDNKTEADVLRKSIRTFEGLIKHQLKSLKGLWDSTYSIYKSKINDMSMIECLTEPTSCSLFVLLIISQIFEKPISNLSINNKVDKIRRRLNYHHSSN